MFLKPYLDSAIITEYNDMNYNLLSRIWSDVWPKTLKYVCILLAREDIAPLYNKLAAQISDSYQSRYP